ncbi:MAG: hypothetical protein LBE35_02370 [Clostridiales bacterium]|nr:hypothetical protein [Clostridiales bacterium]
MAIVKIGKIVPKLFESIFPILTDDVIITEKQIIHIKVRHPGDYELYAKYIPEILEKPDYIIEANKPDTAVLLKEFEENGLRFQLVLRLKAAYDPKSRQNSIITFMKIRRKEWNRLLNNKNILYKSV